MTPTRIAEIAAAVERLEDECPCCGLQNSDAAVARTALPELLAQHRQDLAEIERLTKSLIGVATTCPVCLDAQDEIERLGERVRELVHQGQALRHAYQQDTKTQADEIARLKDAAIDGLRALSRHAGWDMNDKQLLELAYGERPGMSESS